MDLNHTAPARFADAQDQLHAIVTDETGFSDFGPDDYRPGLDMLLLSMDRDPAFSDEGRRAAWGQVIGVLGSRAHAIDAMKATPGYDAAAIVSPVVITGVPRTGTTALHRLMAVDQRFQGLQSWLLDAPMPRPPIESWDEHPAFRKSAAILEARYAAAPGKRAAHHIAAEEVHECCMLLRQSFVSNLWSCGWSAPSYDAWWSAADESAAYAHYRACVALIGSSSPDKRWLLKNPGHIGNLDLLFAVFPAAKVIQTHRDPARAVPSLVSLLMQLHPVMEKSDPDLRARVMLRREVGKWADAVARAQTVEASHADQVLHVVHADFHRDPMAVLERIYAFIGMDIPDDTRAGMAQRIEDKPELSRGVHRYSIADFGMTEAEARAPFGAYVERFDLIERRS